MFEKPEGPFESSAGYKPAVTTARREFVTQVWNWLPAFRAAAEYQSLQRAGLALSVSPSALSRSIKLLEQALGVTLFDRSPAGLTLTAHGDRLLSVTRAAMRLVHDGLPQSGDDRLLAGAVGPVLPSLLCDAAIEVTPGWPMELREVTAETGGDALRRGELDAVLTHLPLRGPGLDVLPLPALEVVLAGPPRTQRARVACLDGAPFQRADAQLRAPSLALLTSLSERLALVAWLPKVCVPASWVVLEEGKPVEASLWTREYPSSAPAHLLTLRARLAARLRGAP